MTRHGALNVAQQRANSTRKTWFVYNDRFPFDIEAAEASIYANSFCWYPTDFPRNVAMQSYDVYTVVPR